MFRNRRIEQDDINNYEEHNKIPIEISKLIS